MIVGAGEYEICGAGQLAGNSQAFYTTVLRQNSYFSGKPHLLLLKTFN